MTMGPTRVVVRPGWWRGPQVVVAAVSQSCVGTTVELLAHNAMVCHGLPSPPAHQCYKHGDACYIEVDVPQLVHVSIIIW
jgi:hypothetical protein